MIASAFWSCYHDTVSLSLTIVAAVTLKYSNDSIRRLIGPLGALKRKIEEETGSSEIYCDHIINFVVPFIVPLMGNVQLNSQWVAILNCWHCGFCCSLTARVVVVSFN